MYYVVVLPLADNTMPQLRCSRLARAVMIGTVVSPRCSRAGIGGSGGGMGAGQPAEAHLFVPLARQRKVPVVARPYRVHGEHGEDAPVLSQVRHAVSEASQTMFIYVSAAHQMP